MESRFQADDAAGKGHPPVGPPMTHQRPWTAADDVTVRLRRCREPLPRTESLYLNTMPRTVEPLELELAQDLPDVCARHGRPAKSRKLIRSLFFDAKPHPRFHRITRVGYRQYSPVSTIVVGVWPVCDRCERSARGYRWLAMALVAVMVANLLALTILVVAAWAGAKADFGTVVEPLVWALFPGTIPIGLCVLVLILRQSRNSVVLRPIYDERFAYVQAHPRFRAAIQAMPPKEPPTDQ